MTGGIVPGCILHCEDFEFHDGETANKFLVVLGAKPGSNYLLVVATSRPHHKTFTPGCHHEQGYYHIPGGSKDWFPKDTWLLLAEPYEMTAAEMVKMQLQEKRLTVKANLRTQLANEIRNCLKLCHDVSKDQLALL